MIENCTENIKSGWKEFILKNAPFTELENDMKSRGVESNLLDAVYPSDGRIFRALSFFEPSDTKLIIIGQDPYPDIEKADGLAFSTSKKSVSLRNIFKCWEEWNLISDRKTAPTRLDHLAEQGVLLLNAMLTRSAVIENGKPNHAKSGGRDDSYLHKFWEPFTKKLVEFAVRSATGKVAMILLGNYAKKLFGDIKHRGLKIFSWKHPSASGRFSDCNCFTAANEWLRNNPINYEVSSLPQLFTSVKVFTDGGCTNNGSKDAIASYGVHIPAQEGIKNPVNISGKLPPREFVFKKGRIGKTKKAAKCTNNRAEFMAFIMAVKYIKKEWPKVDTIDLVSDSNLLVNTLSKWLPSWVKYNKLDSKKNTDLLKIIVELIQGITINTTHVNSHTGGNSDNEIGNQKADDLCNAALKYDTYKVNYE